MADPNRAILERAVLLLEPILDELVIVGGCATGLFVTDEATGGVRPTKDVDVIIEIASYAEYVGRLSDSLRGIGLVEDKREDAPLCRWLHQDLVIDIMPTDDRILGFSNRWYIPAMRSAQTVVIAGLSVRVVAPEHFVATKLEAFHGRGAGDVVTSRDLEDIIAVVDGRPELAAEIQRADADVRSYITLEISRLLASPVFIESLAGFLLPDPASQARRSLIEARLRTLAAMSG